MKIHNILNILLKGWTCCSRKVLEFEEFLKIPGCKKGKHRFTDVKPVSIIIL